MWRRRRGSTDGRQCVNDARATRANKTMDASRREVERDRKDAAAERARPRAATTTATATWRTLAVPVVAFLVGLFTRGVGPTEKRDLPMRMGNDDAPYERFVSEYDLVTIRYATPAAFETDVRALGVTDAEYKACESSALRNPRQKICTRPGVKCFKKKLIYEKDAGGDMQPMHVKRGATEVDCPSAPDFSWLENVGRNLYIWPQFCRERASDGTPICYAEVYCEEESIQWSFESDTTERNQFVIKGLTGQRPEQHSAIFWNTDKSPAWYGGLVPSNMTYPSSGASLTTPYQGKFCLQKAVLKALSRRGWELIEPDEAFKPSWHYDYRYNPAYREDIYAPKTFKVRKYSAI